MVLNTIPRAQRGGLIGAAERVECVSGDPGRVFSPVMVGAKNLFVGTECGFTGTQRFARVAGGNQHAGEIATRATRMGMLGAERLLADRQRALKEQTRRRQ